MNFRRSLWYVNLAQFGCAPSLFVCPAQFLFKLAEGRINGDAGDEDVHFGFDIDGRKRAVAMVIDMVDGCGQYFMLKRLYHFRRGFRVRTPFDFELEMMRGYLSFSAFVAHALINQILQSFDEHVGGKAALALDFAAQSAIHGSTHALQQSPQKALRQSSFGLLYSRYFLLVLR
jgi:hypothetical protein